MVGAEMCLCPEKQTDAWTCKLSCNVQRLRESGCWIEGSGTGLEKRRGSNSGNVPNVRDGKIWASFCQSHSNPLSLSVSEQRTIRFVYVIFAWKYVLGLWLEMFKAEKWGPRLKRSCRVWWRNKHQPSKVIVDQYWVLSNLCLLAFLSAMSFHFEKDLFTLSARSVKLDGHSLIPLASFQSKFNRRAFRQYDGLSIFELWRELLLYFKKNKKNFHEETQETRKKRKTESLSKQNANLLLSNHK